LGSQGLEGMGEKKKREIKGRRRERANGGRKEGLCSPDLQSQK